jgi:hypothetical protein
MLGPVLVWGSRGRCALWVAPVRQQVSFLLGVVQLHQDHLDTKGASTLLSEGSAWSWTCVNAKLLHRKHLCLLSAVKICGSAGTIPTHINGLCMLSC